MTQTYNITRALAAFLKDFNLSEMAEHFHHHDDNEVALEDFQKRLDHLTRLVEHYEKYNTPVQSQQELLTELTEGWEQDCGGVTVKQYSDLELRAAAELERLYTTYEHPAQEYGYMCQIDYDHELYNARGGSLVHPTPEDLIEKHDCAENCGIAKVKVIQVHTEVEGTWYEDAVQRMKDRKNG